MFPGMAFCKSTPSPTTTRPIDAVQIGVLAYCEDLRSILFLRFAFLRHLDQRFARLHGVEYRRIEIEAQ